MPKTNPMLKAYTDERSSAMLYQTLIRNRERPAHR